MFEAMKKFFIIGLSLLALYSCKHDEEPNSEALAREYYDSHYNYPITVINDSGDSIVYVSCSWAHVASYVCRELDLFNTPAKDFVQDYFVGYLSDMISTAKTEEEMRNVMNGIEDNIFFSFVLQSKDGEERRILDTITAKKNTIVLR